MSPQYTTVGGYLNTDPYYVSPEEEQAMADQPMTLVERLRNPAWNGDNVLDTEQTRETMEEAADLIGALWALVGDAARHRPEPKP